MDDDDELRLRGRAVKTWTVLPSNLGRSSVALGLARDGKSDMSVGGG